MSSNKIGQTNEDVTKPPEPVNPDIVGAIVQQGRIGQCLRDALRDVVAAKDVNDDDNIDESEGDKDDDDMSELSGSVAQGKKRSRDRRSKIVLRQHMVESVMERFGIAVAESQRNNEAGSDQKSSQQNASKKRKEPPAALLKGRIDHYQRYKERWRIVVEDPQLKRRSVLPRDRKKKTYPPLWDAVGEQETVKVPVAMELLAYDDLL